MLQKIIQNFTSSVEIRFNCSDDSENNLSFKWVRVGANKSHNRQFDGTPPTTASLALVLGRIPKNESDIFYAEDKDSEWVPASATLAVGKARGRVAD